jgi:hypothetical protein
MAPAKGRRAQSYKMSSSSHPHSFIQASSLIQASSANQVRLQFSAFLLLIHHRFGDFLLHIGAKPIRRTHLA